MRRKNERRRTRKTERERESNFNAFFSFSLVFRPRLTFFSLSFLSLSLPRKPTPPKNPHSLPSFPGSYGSTKRYKSFPRLARANETTVVGAGGELSDFQYLKDLLDELDEDDFCAGDGLRRTPSALCSYLTRVLYNRRSRFDPLWNSLVVGGVDRATGEPFLGAVSMLGVSYKDGHVATGFGAHLARPLFREKHSRTMSRDDAEKLIKEALAVCYYRDKQSINKFQVATVTKDGGVEIGEPFALATEWGYSAFVHPSAHAVGTW